MCKVLFEIAFPQMSQCLEIILNILSRFQENVNYSLF